MAVLPINIIYASTSGNVELVAEEVARYLQQRGHKTSLHRAEVTSVVEITSHKHFIFATSTWEHGRINPFFDKLLAEINSLPAGALSGKHAAFIGLGDKRYEPVLFCEGIETLKKALLTKGMESVGETLKINGEPHGLLESVVKDWCKSINLLQT